MSAEPDPVTVQAGLLLGRPVIDASGTDVGHVVDLKVIQDGPMRDGATATLRVEGLVIGHHGLAERLGLRRHRVHGPWLLKTLAKLGQPCSYLPWSQIDEPRSLSDHDNPVRYHGELHDLTE